MNEMNTKIYASQDWVEEKIASIDSTGGSGDGESEWKIIADITLTEEVQSMDITTDVDGNPFEIYSEIMLIAMFNPNAEGKTSTYNILKTFTEGGNNYGYGLPRHQVAGVPNSGVRNVYCLYRYNPATNRFHSVEMATHTVANAVKNDSYYGNAAFDPLVHPEKIIPVTKFNYNAYAPMGVGSQVRILGR